MTDSSCRESLEQVSSEAAGGGDKNEQTQAYRTREEAWCPQRKATSIPRPATAITLKMVDPEWLDHHPESQMACFITGFTKMEPEEDTGFDGGNEDGENFRENSGDWQTRDQGPSELCIDPALQDTFQGSDNGSNFNGSNFGININAGDDNLDEQLREDFGDEGEGDDDLYM